MSIMNTNMPQRLTDDDIAFYAMLEATLPKEVCDMNIPTQTTTANITAQKEGTNMMNSTKTTAKVTRKTTRSHATQKSTQPARRGKPLPKGAKLVSGPKLDPSGLLLVRSSLETPNAVLNKLSDDILDKTVAIGMELSDATAAEGNWERKPQHRLPAVVMVCSEGMSVYVRKHTPQNFDNDPRKLTLTWDTKNPKRLLAYGLFALSQLKKFLESSDLETFGDDRREQKEYSDDVSDAEMYRYYQSRDLGYRPPIRDERAYDLRNFWRYPEFHSREIAEVDELCDTSEADAYWGNCCDED